jgi:hypothetical protein
MKTIFLIALVLSLLLSSGCAAVQMPSNYVPPLVGQVLHTATSTVLLGVEWCKSALPGTTVLTDGTHYLFVWANAGQTTGGFVGITKTGTYVDLTEAVKAGGNLVNSKSIKDVVSYMQSAGWTKVDPTTITLIVTAAGLRMMQMPVLVISTDIFEGDFDQWMEDTFLSGEEQG